MEEPRTGIRLRAYADHIEDHLREAVTLVNLDQALRVILEECGYEDSIGIIRKHFPHISNADSATITALLRPVVFEAMRRAYRLAESKEELTKMLGEPGLRPLKEGK